MESKNQKINKLVYSVLNCSYTKSTNLKLNGEALKRNWAGWTVRQVSINNVKLNGTPCLDSSCDARESVNVNRAISGCIEFPMESN